MTHSQAIQAATETMGPEWVKNCEWFRANAKDRACQHSQRALWFAAKGWDRQARIYLDFAYDAVSKEGVIR